MDFVINPINFRFSSSLVISLWQSVHPTSFWACTDAANLSGFTFNDFKSGKPLNRLESSWQPKQSWLSRALGELTGNNVKSRDINRTSPTDFFLPTPLKMLWIPSIILSKSSALVNAVDGSGVRKTKAVPGSVQCVQPFWNGYQGAVQRDRSHTAVQSYEGSNKPQTLMKSKKKTVHG